MRGLRNNGFVVSLALLASLVCHFAIQRHFERRNRAAFNLAGAQHSASANAPIFSPEFRPSDVGKFRLPRILDDSQREGRIIPALDIQDDEDSHPRAAPSNTPPSAVPTPTDAAPANAASPDESGESIVEDGNASAVREVIEDELSHATHEEREIWFDEFKTLPAGVVRELLQVRKQLRALPRLLGNMPEKLASTDPTMVPHPHEIAAEPASQKIRFNVPDQLFATAALETAISQLRHNLSNAATPGFKRLRVTLVDTYSSGWQESAAADSPRPDSALESSVQGAGCRIAPLLLDLKQGSLKKTERQFDLAIDGEGFFVRRGEKDFLTRCGAFTLDRDRQLCLAVTTENVVLQPSIKIPEYAREIQISAQGIVTILKSGETELMSIGQLQLGRVASPARLQPAGNTLFVANDDSGTVAFGSPMANGLGELQQGCLEQSNVEFERELDEIEALSSILKALPSQNSHPATARSLPKTPQR